MYSLPCLIPDFDHLRDTLFEPAKTSSKTSVLPPGSTVLVTGVNGYIGSHVADQLLAKGYVVRGTVRSLSKAEELENVFEKKYGIGRFEPVEVSDMTREDAFDDAVKGVTGIAHVASILTLSEKYDEVVPPTVSFAVNILKSAKKESSVKSIVYTSSSTAALSPPLSEEVVVKEDTWNDEAAEAAKKGNVPGFAVYSASKTEAERAFWKSAKDLDASVHVASVLPNFNTGAGLTSAGPGSTGTWLNGVYQGDTSAMFLPPQWMIDVRDTARLHVAALIDPEARDRRIFGFAQPFNWTDVLGIFQKLEPGRKFPDPPANEGRDLSVIPNEFAEELLRRHYSKGFMGLEETIESNTANLRD